MLKKSLSLICLAALSTTLITGCGQNNAGNTARTNNAGAQNYGNNGTIGGGVTGMSGYGATGDGMTGMNGHRTTGGGMTGMGGYGATGGGMAGMRGHGTTGGAMAGMRGHGTSGSGMDLTGYGATGVGTTGRAKKGTTEGGTTGMSRNAATRGQHITTNNNKTLVLGNVIVVARNNNASSRSLGAGANVLEVTDKKAIQAMERVRAKLNSANRITDHVDDISSDIKLILQHAKPRANSKANQRNDR